MRTVKAEVIIDPIWLVAFLKPKYALIEIDAIVIEYGDKEQIVDILEQIYQQDLEQQISR